MLYLATGELPYKDLTLVQMVDAMVKGKPPNVPDTLPAWLQHLLRHCFSFDVVERPPLPHLIQVKTVPVWHGRDSLCGVVNTLIQSATSTTPACHRSSEGS